MITNHFDHISKDNKPKIDTVGDDNSYLLISRINIIDRIKNDRISQRDLMNLYDEHHNYLLSKFSNTFKFAELIQIYDKSHNSYLYVVDNNDINNEFYFAMKDWFKTETEKMIKRLSQIIFI